MDSQIALLGNELLTGERVRLTTLSQADLSEIGAWWDDAASDIITVDQKPITPEGWLAAQQEHTPYLFGIRTLEDQVLIGACRLIEVMWQARHAEAKVVIKHPAFVGQGYESDAIRTLLRYTFMDVNLNRVYAKVSSVEKSMIEAYEQCGMRIEGQQRQAIYQDKDYNDLVVVGILQREWMEQKKT
jgi:RimJ/RimL family protein N-acetyltransferase